MSRPDILLYTANTMNGWKPLIFLHEAWFDRLDAMPRVQEALQLPEPRPSAFGEGDVARAAEENAARFR